METWLLLVICFIIGTIGLGVYTWFLYKSAKSLKANQQEVTAQITKINPHNYLMTSAYKIDVEYIVDGELYRGQVIASRAEVNALKVQTDPGIQIIYDSKIPANCGNKRIDPLRRVWELGAGVVVFTLVIILILGKNYGWWA